MTPPQSAPFVAPMRGPCHTSPRQAGEPGAHLRQTSANEALASNENVVHNRRTSRTACMCDSLPSTSGALARGGDRTRLLAGRALAPASPPGVGLVLRHRGPPRPDPNLAPHAPDSPAADPGAPLDLAVWPPHPHPSGRAPPPDPRRARAQPWCVTISTPGTSVTARVTMCRHHLASRCSVPGCTACTCSSRACTTTDGSRASLSPATT